MGPEHAVRRKIERLTDVATMPKVVTTVASMIDSGSASASAIADEIRQDQVITLKLLRLVNSGFCGFRSPVTSISHATMLVGLDALRMLLFGATLLTLASRRELRGLWEHSLGTARVASVLAERAGMSRPEELAVAGLMHDIGKVILAQAMPKETAEARRVAEQTGRLLIDAEREVIGVTHPEVGGWVAEGWSLPPRLTGPVVYHHAFDPDREFADRIAVVHLADIACRARGFGFPGDHRIPAIDRRAWALAGLSMRDMRDSIAELDRLDGGASWG